MTLALMVTAVNSVCHNITHNGIRKRTLGAHYDRTYELRVAISLLRNIYIQ